VSAARDRFADAVDDALDGAAQGALSSARREILAAHDEAVAEAVGEAEKPWLECLVTILESLQDNGKQESALLQAIDRITAYSKVRATAIAAARAVLAGGK
jgi:hypothetical protein